MKGLAQQTSAVAPSPTLAQDLQRLGAEATSLSQSLPSFTCDETAVSQAIRNGKIVRDMRLSGTLRMVRDRAGALDESYTFKHDHVLFFVPVIPPLYVRGGFDSALSYFSPGQQSCLQYSLSPRRIDFETRTDANASACKQRGMKGFALLNAEGNVTHIERTVPLDVAKPLKLATFAAVDLAPIELNGRAFQLSNHMTAEKPLTGAMGHFEATYTHCHLFAATVTLGPSTEVPPDATANPQ